MTLTIETKTGNRCLKPDKVNPGSGGALPILTVPCNKMYDQEQKWFFDPHADVHTLVSDHLSHITGGKDWCLRYYWNQGNKKVYVSDANCRTDKSRNNWWFTGRGTEKTLIENHAGNNNDFCLQHNESTFEVGIELCNTTEPSQYFTSQVRYSFIN